MTWVKFCASKGATVLGWSTGPSSRLQCEYGAWIVLFRVVLNEGKNVVRTQMGSPVEKTELDEE